MPNDQPPITVNVEQGKRECEHKFVHLRNESYHRSASRYSWEYVSIDYFFCEKCLEEKQNRKEIILGDHELYKLPDWAKTITNKVAGYE